MSGGKSVRIGLFSRGCPVPPKLIAIPRSRYRSSPFALVAKAMKTKKTKMRRFTEMLYWLLEGNAGSGFCSAFTGERRFQARATMSGRRCRTGHRCAIADIPGRAKGP